MTTQLLIYESAIPVSRETHADCSVEGGSTYAFSAHVNSVPLMAVEFPQAAGECPIVFGGMGEEIVPAAVLGLNANENLFLTSDGAWRGTYVPAFLRRYPFVFSRQDDRFVLCVDESWHGFHRDGRGQRLFTPDGAPTPYLDTTVNFLREYQTQFGYTHAFCKKIETLGLLEPMQADVTLAGGARVSLSGFQAVNRDRLKALPEATLAEMAKTDELELIYLHLQSMRNFDVLRARLAERVAAGVVS